MNPEDVEIPPLYTPEQEAQIMKGRKKQADIDAGRAIIQQRMNDRQKALDLKTKLSDQKTASDTKAAGETPYEQGRQIAMNTVPLAAGYAAGHKGADYLDKRFQEAAGYRADQLRNLAAESDRLDPRAVARTSDKLGLGQTRRGGLASYLVPAALGGMGAGVRFVGADHVPNEVGQDVARAFGSAEMGAGMGMLGQMLLQDVSSTPKINAVDLAKIEQARIAAKGKPPMGPYVTSGAPSAAPTPLTPAPASPASTPALAAPDTPSGPTPGTRSYMVDQAKSLGIKGAGNMNKGELAKALANAMTEHGGKRTVGKRIADVASKTAKSGMIAPVAAGAMAYDAMRSPSQADDGTMSEGASIPEAAAVGAGAAGVTAGVPYAISKAPGMLARALGRVAGPVGVGLTAWDLASMASAENAKPDPLLNGPAMGDMPQAPANPQFMSLQQALARQAYGR